MARLDLRRIKRISKIEIGAEPISIGRSTHNKVVLDNSHVSRSHCLIELIDGFPHVRDLQSHGGTYVNGARVTQCRINHGDRIAVGPYDILFNDPLRQAQTDDHNGTIESHELSISVSAEAIATEAIAADHQELHKLREECAAQAERIDALIRQVEEAGERDEALQAANAALQTERDELQARLQQELSRAGEELDQPQQESTSATHEIELARLNEQINELMRQVRETSNREDVLRAERSALQRAHDNLKVEHQEELHRARSEGESLSQQAQQSQQSQANERIDSLMNQVQEANARIESLQTANTSVQQKLDQLQAAHRHELEQARQGFESASRQVEQVRSHEGTLQQQVEALESSRRVMAERAENSSRALSALRNQVQSLDEAARRVAGLQNRLAEIEAAWVQANQQLEEGDDNDTEQLEAAALQRHEYSDELNALNELRDAAVLKLSEAAQHIRALTEQQSMQLATISIGPPPAENDPGEKSPGRRWWKLGR